MPQPVKRDQLEDQTSDQLSRSRKSSYVLIKPEAFSANTGSSQQVVPASEDQRKLRTAEDYDVELFDINTGILPHSNKKSEPYQGLDLDTLDPVLARSLSSEDRVGLRQTASSAADRSSTPPVFSQAEILNSRANRILSSSDSLVERGDVEKLLETLLESREILQQEQKIRLDRLNAVDRTMAEYQKDYDSNGLMVKGTSSAVKAAYVPLHLFGKALDNTLGWKVFQAPPVSLSDMQSKRMQEAEKEKEYRQSLLDSSVQALTSVDKKLDEIREIQGQLTQEIDPGLFLNLTSNLRSKVKEVTVALEKGFDSGDPKLKEDWDKLRKSVSNGFEDLDRQLGLAEASLKAAEKATIIAGAIGATAVTGGLGAGVLVGVVAGTVATGSQMAGHYAGNKVIGGNNFDLNSEIAEVKDDLKDAVLYSVGNCLSGVLALGGRATLSTGQSVAPTFVRGLPLTGLRNLWANAKGLLGNTGMRVAQAGRGVLGGGTAGVITEAPAAVYDTWRARGTAELDPTGELREMGISEYYLCARMLSVRLGSAALGGTMGRGFQGMRNSLTTSLRPERAFNAAGVEVVTASYLNRAGTRAANLVFTVPDLMADIYGGIYSERIIGAWFFGEKGQAREQDVEQIITSSLAGHMAGRMQGSVIARRNDRNAGIAAVPANQLTAEATVLHNRNNLINDTNVVAAFGAANNVDVRRVNAGNERVEGIHVGDRAGLVDFERSRQDHLLNGRLANAADRKLGNHVHRESNRLVNQAVEDIAIQGNRTGTSGTLLRDRIQVAERLQQELRERGSALKLLNRVADRTDPGHDDYVQRLLDHTERYNSEMDGVAGNLLARGKRFIDRIYDPYGVNRAQLKFTDETPKWFERSLNSVRDGLTGSLDFVVGKRVSRGILQGIANVRDLGLGFGLGAFTTTTASVYGSWGLIASSVYGSGLFIGRGLNVGLQGAFLIPSAANSFLNGGIYNRGSADGVGKLTARIAEGQTLLTELQRIQDGGQGAMDPGMFNDIGQRIQVVANQLQASQQLLNRANARRTGLGIGPLSIPRVYERTAEILRTNTIDKILKERPLTDREQQFAGGAAENRNRFLQEQSINEINQRSQEFFNRTLANNPVNFVNDASNRFLNELGRPNVDLARIAEINTLMLSENSNINLLAREQLRTDALAVVQGRLATLAGDDPVRENLLIAQEMLNNLVAPVFNARRITAMTPRGERNQTVNQALDYVTEMINRSDDVTYMRHLVGQMRQGFLAENGGLRRQINQRLQAAIDQRINRADLDLANETNLANLRGELLGGGEITRPQIQISIEDLALGR